MSVCVVSLSQPSSRGLDYPLWDVLGGGRGCHQKRTWRGGGGGGCLKWPNLSERTPEIKKEGIICKTNSAMSF